MTTLLERSQGRHKAMKLIKKKKKFSFVLFSNENIQEQVKRDKKTSVFELKRFCKVHWEFTQ